MPIAPLGIICICLLCISHTCQHLSVSHDSSPQVQPHRPCFCDNITWAEQIHQDPLWESQQCECSLMACNGRTVCAVYCCLDKLLMTCMVWGLHARSECKTTECWGKEWWWVEKKLWKKENGRWSHLPPSITHINAFRDNRVEGEGALFEGGISDVSSRCPASPPLLQTHVPCLVGVTAVILNVMQWPLQ